MAKNSGSSAWNQIIGSIPEEIPFEIAMNADSTNEVWTDIDTDIDDGMALLIYGFEWMFENVDPTVPIYTIIANYVRHTLQFHRNDDSEILLANDDNDLLMQDSFTHGYITSGATVFDDIRKVARRTITLSPTIRALFRSNIDNTQISATTVQITGKIFGDYVRAPSNMVTKFGNIARM